MSYNQSIILKYLDSFHCIIKGKYSSKYLCNLSNILKPYVMIKSIIPSQFVQSVTIIIKNGRNSQFGWDSEVGWDMGMVFTLLNLNPM